MVTIMGRNIVYIGLILLAVVLYLAGIVVSRIQKMFASITIDETQEFSKAMNLSALTSYENLEEDVQLVSSDSTYRDFNTPVILQSVVIEEDSKYCDEEIL